MFGCFSSRKFNAEQSAEYIPLTEYPAYLVARDYSSIYLLQLVNLLQTNQIEISFQTSLSGIKRVKNTRNDRFFVVLVDFIQKPALEGDLVSEPCFIVEYPSKSSLKDILNSYRQFTGEEVEQICSSPKQSVIPSTRIKLRSVEKRGETVPLAKQFLLFVLTTPNDEKYYQQYTQRLRRKLPRSQKVVFLTELASYRRYINPAAPKHYALLMGLSNVHQTIQSHSLQVEHLLLMEAMPVDFSIDDPRFTYISVGSEEMTKYVVKRFGLSEIYENSNSPNRFIYEKRGQPIPTRESLGDVTASHISIAQTSCLIPPKGNTLKSALKSYKLTSDHVVEPKSKQESYLNMKCKLSKIDPSALEQPSEGMVSILMSDSAILNEVSNVNSFCPGASSFLKPASQFQQSSLMESGISSSIPRNLSKARREYQPKKSIREITELEISNVDLTYHC